MSTSRSASSSHRDEPGRFAALLVAIRCSIGRLPYLVAPHPKTALRVMCLAAFDALEVLCHSTRLASNQVQSLCWFLDFAACANAWSDHKEFEVEEFETTRRLLAQAGFADLVGEYLSQLQERERSRPLVGLPETALDEHLPLAIRDYREGVVRLSLQTIAVLLARQRAGTDTMQTRAALGEVSQPTPHAVGLELLFQLAMLCQLIDDVVDYRADRGAGLPSFLTAAGTVRRSLIVANAAAADYCIDSARPMPCLFPFRLARLAMGACAKLVLCWCGWWYQNNEGLKVAGTLRVPSAPGAA